MASNLIIKVSADTKDAAKKLKEMGYNVEVVEKATKKATQAQSAWDKAIKKGGDDSIKTFVNMGAKLLSIAGTLALVKKGIKECFDEALKNDALAKKRLDEINTTWSNIKADFGSGLINSITPALDELYEKLQNIEKWVNRNVSSVTLSKSAQDAARKGEYMDFSGYSADLLYSAMNSLATNMNFGAEGYEYLDRAYQMLEKAYNTSMARGGGGKDSTIPTGSGGDSSVALNWGRTMEETFWEQYGLHMKNAGHQQPLAVEGPAEAVVGGYSANKDHFDKLIREERERQEQIAYEQIVLKQETEAKILEEAQKARDLEAEMLEERKELYKSFYGEVASYAMETYSAITGMMDAYYNEEIWQIEHSTMTEKRKDEELNNLKRRQFEAKQRNSVAQNIMDTASAIMDIWANHAGNPWMAGTLTALATGTGSAQLATILGQSYHPFAEGGIVSSPTHALIGEGGEKEAVLPLSKLKEFVTPPEGAGAIHITVNVADGSRGGDIAEEVYFAIERAQRTGLLPRWKYA